ncbi:MAG: nuclear transport factor 2 family protein [Terriglobales bacterium]
MRTLVCFLICMIGCQAQRPEAQRPEDQVLAVYKQMEKAVQSGDAKTFVGLWCRESASDAEKMGSQLHPQPDVHYTSSKVFVQGDEAALLGQYGKDGFLSMRFVKEDGRWKIKDFAFSDKAYSAESVYAMIPPAAGAFERAGAPWQNVATAFDKADAAKHGFQVRAAYDESFLYIRIE